MPESSRLAALAADEGLRLIALPALRLLLALLLLWLGLRLARVVAGAFERFARRSDLDPMLAVLVRNGLRLLLPAVALIAALDLLGVPVASLLTVLAAAGLAVGLALRDSLANVAGAVMLVTLRPFRVGDQVEAGGASGVVEAVDIFHTRLRTGDNRVIAVPNRNVANAQIVNLTARDRRRIELRVGVGYRTDLRRALDRLAAAIAADRRFAGEPPPEVLAEQFGDSAIELAIRVWVPTEHAGPLRSELLLLVKETLERAGIAIPCPQREIRLLGADRPAA